MDEWIEAEDIQSKQYLTKQRGKTTPSPLGKSFHLSACYINMTKSKSIQILKKKSYRLTVNEMKPCTVILSFSALLPFQFKGLDITVKYNLSSLCYIIFEESQLNEFLKTSLS